MDKINLAHCMAGFYIWKPAAHIFVYTVCEICC